MRGHVHQDQVQWGKVPYWPPSTHQGSGMLPPGMSTHAVGSEFTVLTGCFSVPLPIDQAVKIGDASFDHTSNHESRRPLDRWVSSGSWYCTVVRTSSTQPKYPPRQFLIHWVNRPIKIFSNKSVKFEFCNQNFCFFWPIRNFLSEIPSTSRVRWDNKSD